MTHPNSFSIIRLDGEDAAALAGLEAACFSTSWGAERYRQLFAAARPVGPGLANFSAFGLKEANGALAAFAVVHVSLDEVEIYNIAVRPDLRQNGLGKRLLAGVLALAEACGVTRAVLEVRVGNLPARKLYASLGLFPCGRRKGYYADTGEDALVLCREFTF